MKSIHARNSCFYEITNIRQNGTITSPAYINLLAVL